MGKQPRMEPLGRIAFRVEGKLWCAYSAPREGMKGKILLGAIALTLVERKDRYDEFRELMQRCFADKVEEITGVRPIFPFPPQPAPESERSGNA